MDFYVIGNSVYFHQWRHTVPQAVVPLSGDLVASGVSANTWHHVAITRSGTDSKIFLDGNLGQQKTAADYIGLTGTYYLGWYNTTNNAPIAVDDLRLSSIARYTSNFTPQTTPFVRDEYTKLLLHFDENGDDPRNTGKAIDDSGNANHGTITGAKYVSGLVGVDASVTDTGSQPNQSYASHNGIFIEEGTTNKITNPSFEHSTFDTNWATETNSFRDEFTTNESSPIASPRTSEPGPGSFTSTVTSPSTLSISGSRLTYTNTTGNGSPSISSSISYQAGRTIFMSLQKTDGDHAGISLGSSSGWGIGFWGKNMTSSSMNQGAYAMGLPTMPYYATTGPYRYAITMTDEGYLFWLFDGTRWRFSWFQPLSVSGTQNWSFASYAQSGNIDNITISDLPAPFTDNDYLTNINTSSPGSSYTATGVSNAVTYVTVTAATGVDHEIIVRRTDDNNKWVIRGLQASNLIKLIEVNAGVETERASAAFTWSNGSNYQIAVIHDNTNINGIYVYVNDNNAIYYEGATFNATATGIATGSTGTYSSLKQFPRGTNNEYEFLSGEFVTSVSKNTSASYVKFGSSSAKLDNSTNALDGNYFTQVTATATTHTLSAYVYNGTSGAIGGTVDSSVAQLTYSGGSITTTYTDTGGGWWRLTGSFTASATSQQYGVRVKAGKTIYVDGVQLENYVDNGGNYYSNFTSKNYATTYFDGSMGDGYSWLGTANNSSSKRDVSYVHYSPTDNITQSSGTVSFWVYLPYKRPATDRGHGNSDGYFFTQFGDIDGTGLGFSRNSSGLSVCRIGNASSTFTDLTDKQWSHLTIKWDGANYTCYLNGQQATTGTYSTQPTLQGMYLGSVSTWYYVQHTPSIYSDLKIFDTPLSASEIASLYYSGLGSHQIQTDYTEQFSGQEGPVAFWKFDEGYGEIAYDSSNQGNNASISGATWSDDEFGSAPDGKSLQFDGTNDYVAKTHNNDIELDPGTLPFTISTWFKAPSSVSTQQTLISRYSSSGYKLYMNASGQVCFGVDDDSTWGPDDVACSTGSFADSQWHFVTAVKGESAISVYVDAMRVANTTLSITGSLSGSQPTFYTGIDSDGSSNPWKGFIDEVRVYTYALNTAQIMAEYAARGSVKGISAGFIGEGAEGALGQGLVGYWKMDEASWNGTAGEVLDSSGNSNNGVSVGGTSTSTGKYAKGGVFDGSDDYLNMSNPAELNNLSSSKMTVAFWAKKTTDAYFFSKDGGEQKAG